MVNRNSFSAETPKPKKGPCRKPKFRPKAKFRPKQFFGRNGLFRPLIFDKILNISAEIKYFGLNRLFQPKKGETPILEKPEIPKQKVVSAEIERKHDSVNH